MFRVFSCLFVLLAVAAQVPPDLSVGVLPSLFVHGDHFSVGQQIGYHTRTAITDRLNASSTIRQTLEWVQTSNEGKAAYDAMLKTATDLYPAYIEELQGMALGSGVSFQTLFVMNTRSELSSFQKNAAPGVEHCSDYLVYNQGIASKGQSEKSGVVLMGHNEDGGSEDRSVSTLITVHLEGPKVKNPVKFTSFVYPGDLPTVAFFWNEFGTVGTMNGLYPCTCLYGGIGRNFISRDLCEATDIDDAIRRVSITNQATGHSYNLANVHEGRLVNVEVAPGTAESDNGKPRYVVTPIQPNTTSSSSALFRANSYLFLDGIESCESPSSEHRLTRAGELPVADDSASIRRVLGDTEDVEYPIYRTASKAADDDGYTLTTVLFTLRIGRPSSESIVELYLSNPKTREEVKLTIPSLAIQ